MKTIYEMIRYHNELLDEFQAFTEVLCDTYENVDDTPINAKYFDVISKFREEGIFLCCEANQKSTKWMMTDCGFVVTDDMLDKMNTDKDKTFRWMYKDNYDITQQNDLENIND